VPDDSTVTSGPSVPPVAAHPAEEHGDDVGESDAIEAGGHEHTRAGELDLIAVSRKPATTGAAPVTTRTRPATSRASRDARQRTVLGLYAPWSQTLGHEDLLGLEKVHAEHTPDAARRDAPGRDVLLQDATGAGKVRRRPIKRHPYAPLSTD